MTSDITNDEFDAILERLVSEENALLSIPGVYEVLSEYYNNEILDIFDAEQNSSRSK